MSKLFGPARSVTTAVVTAVVLACATGVVAQGPIKISIQPQAVLIERYGSEQFLNFDLMIENDSAAGVRIDSIQLVATDRLGKFVTRRVLDRHGISPGILTLPKTEIGPRETISVFNPFVAFERDISLARLRYELTFSALEGDRSYTAGVDVAPKEFRGRTNLMIPLEGRVIAEYGHDFYSAHRRIDLSHPIVKNIGLVANSARYANDLTICGVDGSLFRGDKNRLENWFGYGARILAPGSGRVSQLADGLPDNTMKDGRVVFSEQIDPSKPSGIFGNYIVIDHLNGEFSVFAHLMKGTFTVKVGDMVRQGQVLGKIGFSGNTDFVHTHFQLQNGASALTAEGLPAYFTSFRRISGGRSKVVRNEPINTGDVVMRN